jgi:hypothetical protein
MPGVVHRACKGMVRQRCWGMMLMRSCSCSNCDTCCVHKQLWARGTACVQEEPEEYIRQERAQITAGRLAARSAASGTYIVGAEAPAIRHEPLPGQRPPLRL